MNSQDKAFAKESLRNRVTVCRHIASSINTNKTDISIVPVVTQIIDILANTFWCCDECSNRYKVPLNGALVRYSPEQLIAQDSEQFSHPFSQLISNEIVSSIPHAVFEEQFGSISKELNLDRLTELYFI